MQDKNEQRIQKLQMITAWQQSGLTQKAFCNTHNIAYHIFSFSAMSLSLAFVRSKDPAFCS
jgi:hypothetical protein